MFDSRPNNPGPSRRARGELVTLLLSSGQRLERSCDTGDCRRQISQDQLVFEPQHPAAQLTKGFITASIGLGARGVVLAVDFNDQPGLWCEEIHDVAAEHDLPAKGNSQLAPANGGEEPGL